MLRRRFMALFAALACGPRALASSFGDNFVPVFFSGDSAELDAEALKVLAQVPAQYAASRWSGGDRPIVISGHVDGDELGRGLRKLALERAKTVADHLAQAGLSRALFRLEAPLKPPMSTRGVEPRNRTALVSW